jgi:hypothetical protein
VGRGSAYADIDEDGDPDVVLLQTGGPPVLLRNEQALGSAWMRFKLVGRSSNRDAIGAEVRVRVGGKELRRTVMPTRSYLSQSELPLTFGLGAVESVESVEVRWPGGAFSRVPTPAVNTLTVIEQD